MRGVAAIFHVQDFKWIRSVALYRLDLACFLGDELGHQESCCGRQATDQQSDLLVGPKALRLTCVAVLFVVVV